MSKISKVTPRHKVTRLRRTRCVHQKSWSAKRFTVQYAGARRDLQCPTAKRMCKRCLIHMMVRECQSEKHVKRTKLPTAQRRTQRGTRLDRPHNPLNHAKSTTRDQLHMVQSATATPRTTHVTTCAELLPRLYPRASDGQDALTFCPNGSGNL